MNNRTPEDWDQTSTSEVPTTYESTTEVTTTTYGSTTEATTTTYGSTTHESTTQGTTFVGDASPIVGPRPNATRITMEVVLALWEEYPGLFETTVIAFLAMILINIVVRNILACTTSRPCCQQHEVRDSF